MTLRLDWLETGTGAALLAEEREQVAAALESVFGDHLLQIGPWGDPAFFRGFARTRRSAVLATSPAAGVDCVCAPDDLPVATDSIDAVLLPHSLETADDPYGVLREVDRILRPDGRIVLLSFNPLGWWGVRHLLSRRRFPGGVQRMLGEHRLRDWLQLLSYRVQLTSYYHFVAPLFRGGPRPGAMAGAGLRRSRQDPGCMVSGALRLLTPITRARVFAGCYLLVARKEVLALTPLRPVFRRRARLVGGLVNPTTRNAA